MKALALLGRFLCWLVVLTLGVLFLCVALMKDPLRHLAMKYVFDFTELHLLIRVLPGLFLIALSFWVALPLTAVGSRSSVIAFSTANGPVEVSIRAVNDLVTQLCKSVAGVKEVQSVRVFQRKTGIDVSVEISLAEGFTVPNISTTCQEKVKQGLGSTLGIEKVRNVGVSIGRLEQGASSGPAGKDGGESFSPFESTPPDFDKDLTL